MTDKRIEKKHNNFIFFSEVLIMIIIISLIIYIFSNSSFIANILSKYVPNIRLFGGYFHDIIKELILCIIGVLLIKVSNHKDCDPFNAKEKTGRSILLGWPMFGCALHLFLFALYEIIFIDKGFELYEVIGLFVFSLCIGLAEEFLWRGFFQNEIISRYGNTPKKIAFSIFICSLMFGFMHILNFVNGQELFSTLLQIFYTAGLGIGLGTIYYKTNNIWAVALIHGFYDFMISLHEITLLQNYRFGYNPLIIQILSSVGIIIGILIYILYAIKLLKHDEIINKKTKFNIIIFFLILFYFLNQIYLISLSLK